MDSIPGVGNQLPADNSYKQGEEVKQSARIDIEKGGERCDIEEEEVAIASNNIVYVVDAADPHPPPAVNVLELPNGTRISLKVIVSGTSVKVAGNVVPAPAEADVQIELPDGTKLSSVIQATPAWELIVDNRFPKRKLTKIVISFSSQLAAAFAAGALSIKSPSILISSPSSYSSSSSTTTTLVSPSWTAVTFTVANLIGFVSVIIASSFENKGPLLLAGWPILGRRNLSCLTAKLGLAAVASAVVIAMGAALHLGTKGHMAFTAAACLPTFLALAVA